MTKPILEHYARNEWLLKCPSCGETFTHLFNVETWFREQEDSETGIHVAVYSGCNWTQDGDMKCNPSRRRDGSVLSFHCEYCGPFFMILKQHKGQTFVHLEYFNEDEKPKTHKELYHEYLQSPEWDEKRKAKLKEAGYRCQLCNAQTELSVHHRTYQNVFMELPEDLIALCQKCHEKFHDLDEA